MLGSVLDLVAACVCGLGMTAVRSTQAGTARQPAPSYKICWQRCVCLTTVTVCHISLLVQAP